MHLLIGILFFLAATCGDIFLRAAEASPEENAPADLNSSRSSPYEDQGEGVSSNGPIEKESFGGPEMSRGLPEAAGGILEAYERDGVREYELSDPPEGGEESTPEAVVVREVTHPQLLLKKRTRDAEKTCAQWRDTNSLRMYSICQDKKRALQALKADGVYLAQKSVEEERE